MRDTIPTLSNLCERQQRRIFVGAIVSPVSPLKTKVINHGVLGVGSRGVIRFVEELDTEGDTSTAGLSDVERKAIDSILARHKWSFDDCQVTILPYGQFLCPGFVDTHTHACQVPNIGLGQQYELLDWLNNVTFPRERRFAEEDYAEKTYNSVVQRLIDSGTTTACYYATLHLEATKRLARICTERGQRAFVGKVQMDRNSPQDYIEESASASMRDTDAFVKYCRTLHKQSMSRRKEIQSRQHDDSGREASSASAQEESSSPSSDEGDRGRLPFGEDLDEDEVLMQQSISRLSKPMEEATGSAPLTSAAIKTAAADSLLETRKRDPSAHSRERATALSIESALVQPILTPRFAISCTDALLSGISAMISREPGLRLQTHLSESPGEIEYTKSLFPFAESYTGIYDHFSLLTDRTILAHAIHLDDSELELLSRRNCGISHCPTSNLNLRSGASRMGEMLNRGIKVSLGTDISGGFGLGMLSAIREASVVAKVLNFTTGGKEIQSTTRSLGGGPDAAAAEAETLTKEEENVNVGDEVKTVATTTPKHDFTKGPLTIPTLFWVATLGGAQVASVDNRVGSLTVGKDFDALLVKLCPSPAELEQQETDDDEAEPYAGNPSCFVEPGEPLETLLEKFLFTADDRNLEGVWVRGRLIGGIQMKKERKRR